MVLKKLVTTTKIDEKLKIKGLSRRESARLTGYPWGSLNQMITGKTSFSKNLKEKLLPILEVSREEFESWIIADKYQSEIIQKAIESFKNREDKKTLVLTQNIDKILKEKNMSRTALAKSIKYDQPSVNNMITGKISMSKTVLTRISEFLEIPVEDLQAWIVADKYSLQVLELACAL